VLPTVIAPEDDELMKLRVGDEEEGEELT